MEPPRPAGHGSSSLGRGHSSTGKHWRRGGEGEGEGEGNSASPSPAIGSGRMLFAAPPLRESIHRYEHPHTPNKRRQNHWRQPQGHASLDVGVLPENVSSPDGRQADAPAPVLKPKLTPMPKPETNPMPSPRRRLKRDHLGYGSPVKERGSRSRVLASTSAAVARSDAVLLPAEVADAGTGAPAPTRVPMIDIDDGEVYAQRQSQPRPGVEAGAGGHGDSNAGAGADTGTGTDADGAVKSQVKKQRTGADAETARDGDACLCVDVGAATAAPCPGPMPQSQSHPDGDSVPETPSESQSQSQHHTLMDVADGIGWDEGAVNMTEGMPMPKAQSKPEPEAKVEEMSVDDDANKDKDMIPMPKPMPKLLGKPMSIGGTLDSWLSQPDASANELEHGDDAEGAHIGVPSPSPQSLPLAATESASVLNAEAEPEPEPEPEPGQSPKRAKVESAPRRSRGRRGRNRNRGGGTGEATLVQAPAPATLPDLLNEEKSSGDGTGEVVRSPALVPVSGRQSEPDYSNFLPQVPFYVSQNLVVVRWGVVDWKRKGYATYNRELPVAVYPVGFKSLSINQPYAETMPCSKGRDNGKAGRSRNPGDYVDVGGGGSGSGGGDRFVYVNEIVEGSGEPVFRITCPATGEVINHSSLTGVYEKLKMMQYEFGTRTKETKYSGPKEFGLSSLRRAFEGIHTGIPSMPPVRYESSANGTDMDMDGGKKIKIKIKNKNKAPSAILERLILAEMHGDFSNEDLKPARARPRRSRSKSLGSGTCVRAGAGAGAGAGGQMSDDVAAMKTAFRTSVGGIPDAVLGRLKRKSMEKERHPASEFNIDKVFGAGASGGICSDSESDGELQEWKGKGKGKGKGTESPAPARRRTSRGGTLRRISYYDVDSDSELDTRSGYDSDLVDVATGTTGAGSGLSDFIRADADTYRLMLQSAVQHEASTPVRDRDGVKGRRKERGKSKGPSLSTKRKKRSAAAATLSAIDGAEGGDGDVDGDGDGSGRGGGGGGGANRSSIVATASPLCDAVSTTTTASDFDSDSDSDADFDSMSDCSKCSADTDSCYECQTLFRAMDDPDDVFDDFDLADPPAWRDQTRLAIIPFTDPVPFGTSARTRAFRKITYEQKERWRVRMLIPPLPPRPKDDDSRFLNMSDEKKYEKLQKLVGQNCLKIVLGKSFIHGYGMFARTMINAGEIVIEYVGEIVRNIVADYREKEYHAKGIPLYFFRIGGDQIIDATLTGNKARLINHSCEPNCESRTITVKSTKHIVIQAKRDIARMEEITYDYSALRCVGKLSAPWNQTKPNSHADVHSKFSVFNFEEGDKKEPCYCRAKNCRKFMN